MRERERDCYSSCIYIYIYIAYERDVLFFVVFMYEIEREREIIFTSHSNGKGKKVNEMKKATKINTVDTFEFIFIFRYILYKNTTDKLYRLY